MTIERADPRLLKWCNVRKRLLLIEDLTSEVFYSWCFGNFSMDCDLRRIVVSTFHTQRSSEKGILFMFTQFGSTETNYKFISGFRLSLHYMVDRTEENKI